VRIADETLSGTFVGIELNHPNHFLNKSNKAFNDIMRNQQFKQCSALQSNHENHYKQIYNYQLKSLPRNFNFLLNQQQLFGFNSF
jgi:hypothetical protein